MPALLLSEDGAYHDFGSGVCVLFIQPATFRNIPPGTHAHETGVKFFTGWKRQVMVEPGPDHFRSAAVRQSDRCIQKGRKVNYVKSPEDRFQLTEFILLQIRHAELFTVTDIIDVREQGRILRPDHNICTVCFELLIDLVANIQHDVEHSCRERGTQRDCEGNEKHFSALMIQHPADHFKQHFLSPSFSEIPVHRPECRQDGKPDNLPVPHSSEESDCTRP